MNPHEHRRYMAHRRLANRQQWTRFKTAVLVWIIIIALLQSAVRISEGM